MQIPVDKCQLGDELPDAHVVRGLGLWLLASVRIMSTCVLRNFINYRTQGIEFLMTLYKCYVLFVLDYWCQLCFCWKTVTCQDCHWKTWLWRLPLFYFNRVSKIWNDLRHCLLRHSVSKASKDIFIVSKQTTNKHWYAFVIARSFETSCVHLPCQC